MDSDHGSAVLIDGRWRADDLPDPPDSSATGTPRRRRRSIRRTSHLDVTWADGPASTLELAGRGRDLYTPAAGATKVLDGVGLEMQVSPTRTITKLSVNPNVERVDALVGSSTRGGFRARVNEAIPASPLRSMLDDVPIVTQICAIAWYLPAERTAPPSNLQLSATGGEAPYQRTRTGNIVCSGLRPGGFAQVNREHGRAFPHFVRVAGDLTDPDDPEAWHSIAATSEVCMRRRRRIDVWHTIDGIAVDAHYRDSTWGEGHIEHAVHEYSIRALVDPDSRALRAIDVTARVLPFPECPLAAPHAERLVGMDVTAFRRTVADALTELRACTHLNDMIRALADVPSLADHLRVA